MSNEGIPLRYLGDLERIKYDEGDVFVLFASTFIRAEQQESMRKHWEIVMPGSKLIILQGDVKLGILTKEQVNEATSQG